MNRGRYRLELSVGDLPGSRGCSCDLQMQSYQNWLGEDDPKIIELQPQSKSDTMNIFHILCPCIDNLNHTSWSMDPGEHMRSRQVITKAISPGLQLSPDQRLLLIGETWMFQGDRGMTKEKAIQGFTHILNCLERRGNLLKWKLSEFGSKFGEIEFHCQKQDKHSKPQEPVG